MSRLNSMMFFAFASCVRQQSDSNNDLRAGRLKRFLIDGKPYACSEEEFHHLLRAWRMLAREHPEALFIEEAASFNDPDDERIGWHDFLNHLQLPELEIANLFKRLLDSTTAHHNLDGRSDKV
jgi:hypothetical protein